ncbi:MAG: phage holin family protein [Verrucomicrobiota bacterium]
MNPLPGMARSSPPDASAEHRAATSLVAGWSEALGALLSCRIALIQLESKTAARQAGQLGALLAGAALATCFAWALLLAGGIAALAAATRWPWHWFALAAAAAHALAAAIGLYLARSAARPAFPITRAEFHKDREWLETLKSPRKSNS